MYNTVKFLSFLLLVTCYWLLVTGIVEAKILPQARKSGTVTSVKSSTGSGIGVSPKLRADRKELNLYFSNLGNASSVSYFLTYKQVSSNGSKTSEQEEGAGGVLTLTGSSSQTAELLFGTCSKNVCRYHTGIKDAKLEVNYTTKSGKKYIKRYRIKV